VPRLRVALVGVGGITRFYRRAYARSPLAELVALIDVDAQAALDAAHDCGVDPSRATTRFERALEDDVDAVVVNTPNHLHREQGTAVLRAGKHLLMQKPLAPTLADAEALAREARGADVVAGLYHSYLDHPLVHELRASVAAGNLGEIVHVYGRLTHRGGIAWSNDAVAGNATWRSSLAQTGGGCFIQLGVHYLQLATWISGGEPVAVRGSAANVMSPGIEGEDLATAIVRYKNGMQATVDTGWIADGEELAVAGTSGTARYLDQRWWIAPGEAPREWRPPAFDDVDNPYNGHRAFLEACAGLKEIPVPLVRGLTEMRLVDAFYRSAQNGGQEAAVEAVLA